MHHVTSDAQVGVGRLKDVPNYSEGFAKRERYRPTSAPTPPAHSTPRIRFFADQTMKVSKGFRRQQLQKGATALIKKQMALAALSKTTGGGLGGLFGGGGGADGAK